MSIEPEDNPQTEGQWTDNSNRKRIYVPNGDRIRELRIRAQFCNWAAMAAASVGGVSSSSIRDAERSGLSSCRTLQAIARLLGGEWIEYLDADAPQNRAVLNESRSRDRSLAACIPDILNWERLHPTDVPFEVATLAIDLALGWTLIHTAIAKTISRRVNFRILMMTADDARLPSSAPPEVRAWSKASGANLGLLATRLADYDGPKTISVEVREYCEMPLVHGLRAGKAPRSLFAVSRCQWLAGPPPSFSYGENLYRMLEGDAPGAGDVALLNEYSDRFDELWKPGPVLLKRSSNGEDNQKRSHDRKSG